MLVVTTRNVCDTLKQLNYTVIKGIFWKVLSCGSFAAGNVLVRYLSGGVKEQAHPLPITVIIFYQNIIGFLVFLPLVLKTIPQASNNSQLNKTTDFCPSIINNFIGKLCFCFKNLFLPKNLLLRWMRFLVAVVGMILWYVSLSKMQVTQVVAISFLSPVITIVGAAIFLQETLDLNKLIAIILSIAGGFFICRPDVIMKNNWHNWYTLFPILASLIFSVDKLIVRKILNNQECPKFTTVYLLLFSALICLGCSIFSGEMTFPNYANILQLVLLGIFGAAAQFALHKSLEVAEITVVIPYGISKMVFSAVFSYIFFAEVPNTFGVWFGVIVMTLSTLLLA